MARPKLPELAAEAHRRNLEQLARLGGEAKTSRIHRHLTQKQLGTRVGLSQSAMSEIERGYGGGYSLDTWQRLFLALDRPLILNAPRDPLSEPTDAAHLAIQELVLRSAKLAGLNGTFELPVRPAASRHSVDVFLRSNRHRLLLVCECWNTFGDIGASVRSFRWKVAQAEELGIALGGEEPYHVRGCWIVRATAANRVLLRRYPAAFESQFPGSSIGWMRTLTVGAVPPDQPGLLWSDAPATRLFPFRRPR